MTTCANTQAIMNGRDTLAAVFVWSDDGEVQFFQRHDNEYDEEGYPASKRTGQSVLPDPGNALRCSV